MLSVSVFTVYCTLCIEFLLMAHFHDTVSIGCLALETSPLIGHEVCPAHSSVPLIGRLSQPAARLLLSQHTLYKISFLFSETHRSATLSIKTEARLFFSHRCH